MFFEALITCVSNIRRKLDWHLYCHIYVWSRCTGKVWSEFEGGILIPNMVTNLYLKS